MALLLDERTAHMAGEVILGEGPLAVRCRVTVEWLQGIREPTWYGYLIPLDEDVSVLPGRYGARIGASAVEVLVRRPCLLEGTLCFPFWGLAAPPEISAADMEPLLLLDDAE